MRIGVINMPGRNTYDGQSIKTRFFILGLPLFPTGCIYKISENLGIDVPLTGKDMLHAYAKIHFGILGFGGLAWAASLRGSNASMKPFLIILSLALLALCIYSWVAHSEAKGDEILQRRIFGKAFLYNMPPEYLPIDVQKSLFAELLKIYSGKFTKLDWQKDIHTRAVTKSNFALLYTLAYYQKTLQSTTEHHTLFKEMTAYLNKEKKVKIDPSQDSKTTGSPPKAAPFETNESTQKTRPSENVSNKSTTTEQPNAPQTIKMTVNDSNKLYDAQERITKQVLMVFGLVAFGFIVVAILTPSKSLLIYVFLMCLVLYGIITAIVFLPGYLKLGKDLDYRQKIRIKVRIRDLVQEAGTAYFILQPNKYGINKMTAPAKYYSMDLLNKELEIYISKESHTLLDLIKIGY